jgi:DNA-binding transcriptional MerR regulator/effector-binding domain-containing protein
MKVETEGLLSIGRFARWSGLTVKALRHYAEIGLLRPAYVDDWTGYRWYEPAQVRDAVAIRRLRALRVPLERIAILVHADEATLREALEVHRAQLEGELVETRQVLGELDRLIEGKEKLVTELVLELTIVDEPGGRYAVAGDRVRVDDLFTFIPETCMRVCRWLEEHEVQYDEVPLAIFRGNADDEWLDTEVGWPIGDATLAPADGIRVRELPPTRAAEHVHRGPYEAVPDVYCALDAAIRGHGLTPQDPAREHFLVSPASTANPDEYLTRIVWPVAPASSA